MLLFIILTLLACIETRDINFKVMSPKVSLVSIHNEINRVFDFEVDFDFEVENMLIFMLVLIWTIWFELKPKSISILILTPQLESKSISKSKSQVISFLISAIELESKSNHKPFQQNLWLTRQNLWGGSLFIKISIYPPPLVGGYLFSFCSISFGGEFRNGLWFDFDSNFIAEIKTKITCDQTKWFWTKYGSNQNQHENESCFQLRSQNQLRNRKHDRFCCVLKQETLLGS